MNRSELAIAKTVIYASLFDYPLTLPQLHESLMAVPLSEEEILATYGGSAALRSIIEYREGFFFLEGCGSLVAERRRREARSREFLARHARTLRWIGALPFTRMVALSGSIAHHNLEDGGDLDLFIVARRRRVWTVTVATIVLARLLGSRRVVCANFVMSDERLTLEQQDLFTANQAIHLKPLIGPEVMEGFIAANPFIRRIYPNRPAPSHADAALAPSPRLLRVKRIGEMIAAIPGPAMEWFCHRAYGWHLQRRADSWRSPEQVLLRADCVKLHTQSHRRSVLDRFTERLDEALAQSERAAIA